MRSLSSSPLLCLSRESLRKRVILSEGIANEIPAATFRVLMPITSPSSNTETQKGAVEERLFTFWGCWDDFLPQSKLHGVQEPSVPVGAKPVLAQTQSLCIIYYMFNKTQAEKGILQQSWKNLGRKKKAYQIDKRSSWITILWKKIKTNTKLWCTKNTNT